MKTLKKFLPDPYTIPAILIIGGTGAVVVSVLFPETMAKVSGAVMKLKGAVSGAAGGAS